MTKFIELPKSASVAAAAGILAVTVAGSALAADLGPYGRQPARQSQAPAYYGAGQFNWSGLYFGIQGGYGWGNTEASSTTLSTGGTQAFSYDTSGYLGGIHAGYNWQANNFVYGLETDLEATGLDGRGSSAIGGIHGANVDWLGSFRGRVGYAADNTLFYLTGGLAYGGISIDRGAGGAAPVAFSHDNWRTGWTAGGGIEHAFTPSITARIEYRYTDLGSTTFTSGTANVIDTSDVTHSAVRAGLSFRF